MAKAKKNLPKKNIAKKSNLKKRSKKILPSKAITARTTNTFLSTLCDQLEKASAGLLNTSESDFPYKFFSFSRRDLFNATDKFSATEFLSGIGISEELTAELQLPVDKLIEVRPLDNFFPSIDTIAGFYGTTTSDPKVIAESRRFRKLEALLRKKLTDVNVFRVGQVEIRCYIAGFVKSGSIAGLVTTSIET